jgi:hypothetical protein
MQDGGSAPLLHAGDLGSQTARQALEELEKSVERKIKHQKVRADGFEWNYFGKQKGGEDDEWQLMKRA